MGSSRKLCRGLVTSFASSPPRRAPWAKPCYQDECNTLRTTADSEHPEGAGLRGARLSRAVWMPATYKDALLSTHPPRTSTLGTSREETGLHLRTSARSLSESGTEAEVLRPEKYSRPAGGRGSRPKRERPNLSGSHFPVPKGTGVDKPQSGRWGYSLRELGQLHKKLTIFALGEYRSMKPSWHKGLPYVPLGKDQLRRRWGEWLPSRLILLMKFISCTVLVRLSRSPNELHHRKEAACDCLIT